MTTGERPEICLPCGVARATSRSLVGHGAVRATAQVGVGPGATS